MTMATLLLTGRLILALVFAVAGLTKLSDRSGSRPRQAVIEFGLPSSIAGPLGLLLPLAELAVAANLILASTALWGAFIKRCPFFIPRPTVEKEVSS